MGKDGWLTLGWPKEYGGQERSADGPADLHRRGRDRRRPGAVPHHQLRRRRRSCTTAPHEQKAFFLPKIAAGELHFSIGYSEPEAGTDLACLRTTAVKDGDDYVINGQKMWTSLIQYADYVWLAVPHRSRTPRSTRASAC